MPKLRIWTILLLITILFIGNSGLSNLHHTEAQAPAERPVIGYIQSMGTVRIRAEPSQSARVAGQIAWGEIASIVGASPDGLWYEIVYENITGWVLSDWFEVVAGPSQSVNVPVNVPAVPPPNTAPQSQPNSANFPAAPENISGAVRSMGTLRIRTEPGSGSTIGNLAWGEVAALLGVDDTGKWYLINYNGMTGWVSADWVRIEAGTVPASTSNTTASSVSVPGTSTGSVAVPASGYISGISATSTQIFRNGQARGNRANVFTKVGDSNSAGYFFLYPIGINHHNLRGYSNLQSVISFFQGGTAINGNSFASTSYAAHESWFSSSVLDPTLAQSACNAGETPLACEYRLSRPAISIIMIGTKDASSGLPLDQYETNLRRIVQITVDAGVIPVLTTLPPANHAWGEQIPAYNAVISRVAQSFGVPLVDYYSAMVNLPQRGMSDDGIHPSVPPGSNDAVVDLTPENLQYGFTVRNLLTLQALDMLWRNVIGG